MALEQTFFSGNKRREFQIEDYKPLKSAGSERRKKLLVSIPLGEDSMLGIPDWIGRNYETVASKAAHTARANMDPELKSMTLELFATEQGEHRALLLTKTMLNGFHIVRVGLEEKAKYWLFFHVYTPDSKELHDFLYDYHKQVCFVLFSVDQPELNFDGDVSGEDESLADAVTEGGMELEPDYEAERREATDPKHDAEFGHEPARSSKLVSLGGKKRQTRGGTFVQ